MSHWIETPAFDILVNCTLIIQNWTAIFAVWDKVESCQWNCCLRRIVSQGKPLSPLEVNEIWTIMDTVETFTVRYNLCVQHNEGFFLCCLLPETETQKMRLWNCEIQTLLLISFTNGFRRLGFHCNSNKLWKIRKVLTCSTASMFFLFMDCPWMTLALYAIELWKSAFNGDRAKSVKCLLI